MGTFNTSTLKYKEEYIMKYSEEDYLDYDVGAGDRDVDIRYQSTKLVKTRKPHLCVLCDTEIPSKTKMLRDKAIVEGEWGSCYMCIPCLDKELESYCDALPSHCGKSKYPPNGYYDEDEYDHEFPCTCITDYISCKGECGCKACHTAYMDFLSEE